MPPSPAPSSNGGLLQNDIQALLQHNATVAYPQERYHDEGVHFGSPQLSQAELNLQQGQQTGYGQYHHQHQDSGLGMRYENFNEYQGVYYDPYSTPATSPPTPSMHTRDVLRTRSGLGIQRVHQTLKPKLESQARIAKSPRPKKSKKDKVKSENKVGKLEKPLSELTKNLNNKPIVDIEAYVHRSAEVRRKEVNEGKIPGKVKRPMNSFMLYRKAYQNRTKDWCLQNNHQVVSQVCGDSWPLEPDEVKAQFNEWARIERINHQNAHPGYKFSPTKSGTGKGGKVKNKPEEPLTEESDLDDYDWQGGRSRGTRKPRPVPHNMISEPVEYPSQRSAYHYSPDSRESSIDPSYGYNASSYQATNPGRQPPPQYSQHLPNNQYWQQNIRPHPTMDGVEDIILTKTAAPGMMHPLLTGISGAFDMMDQQYQNFKDRSVQHQEQKIDPSLLSHSGNFNNNFGDQHNDGVYLGDTQLDQKFNTSFMLDPSLNDPVMSFMGGDEGHDDMLIHDPHAADILKGNQDGWHVQSLDSGPEFDKWGGQYDE